MHLVMFQVLDRQKFTVVDDKQVPIGEPSPPPPSERGWKDTVAVYPYEIVRVIARFTDYAGAFPYHCHILEHEDHDMMRQFEVVEAPGQDGTQEPPKDGGCCQVTNDPPFGQLCLWTLTILLVRRRRRR
jgi:spore coat protein A